MIFLAVLAGSAAAAPVAGPVASITLRLKDPAEVTRPGLETIAIEGGITPQVAAQFARLLDSRVHVLAIYSSGGDPESGRAIGRLVHEHGLTVMVAGACAAVCAKYIFLAGAQRLLEPGSLVAFSDTAASITLVASHDPDPAVRALYAGEIAADAAYYRDIGIPERLLYDPHGAMHPQCYELLRSADGKVKDIGIANRFAMAVLPKSYFDSLGVEVSGSWPTEPAALLDAAGKLFRPGAQVGLLLKVNIAPLEDVRNGLAATAPCTPDQLRALGGH